MASNTVTVKTWNELNDILFENTYNAGIKRHRSNFAYRGVNNYSYKLSNGLSRMGKPYSNMEQNLIKQFKKYSHDKVQERDSEWHWLSIAQHHGLPTRLLDWTYSPFIALHFATNNIAEFSVDSAVWKVNFAEVHALLPKEFREKLDATGANIFSFDDLSNSIKGLSELDKKSSTLHDIGVFFEPPSIDERIVNQFAYFSALSDPFLDFDQWLDRPDISKSVSYTKIIIDKSIKWEIRDKLDQSNVNERVLMPGLDGLCAWLKRHYTPR